MSNLSRGNKLNQECMIIVLLWSFYPACQGIYQDKHENYSTSVTVQSGPVQIYDLISSSFKAFWKNNVQENVFPLSPLNS